MLLVLDPQKRATSSVALDHKWFQSWKYKLEARPNVLQLLVAKDKRAAEVHALQQAAIYRLNYL